MHRILIVDDDPVIRRLLSAVLSVEHSVTEADCTEAALRVLDLDDPFDLIMVDWMMPGRTGVDLIRSIRQTRGPVGSVPIIMLTAKGGVEAEEQAYAVGADAYLTKPFDAEILEALIDVMIQASAPTGLLHRAAVDRSTDREEV